MENFKSFGRKLTVPFSRGFTAITGPNGSGKSNIGDAILFVLGPRSSKAIRAGKLSELIFNGGKDGNPAKECTVSLVFDNSDRLMPIDADEVKLTRRIRRAPKPDDPDAYYSYFKVNDNAASLKEFADLLDHARISADGYNIVTQGSVLNLVQMSPTDRRRIIEGIAGITEFDKDIDRAEKQKAEVEANLERIGIVLDEIDRNLRQLKRDRDGALRYQELSAELTTRKGQRAVAVKRDVEARIARNQERIEKLEADRAKLVEKVNVLREAQRGETRNLAKVETEIEETGGDEVREVQELIKGLRDQRSKAEANANYAHDEIHELDEELAELKKDLTRIEKELAESQQAATTHDEHATAVRETAQRLDKELNDYKDSIAQSDSDAMDVQRKLAKLKQEHEKVAVDRHEADLSLDRLHERRDSAHRHLQDAEDAERVIQTDIDEVDVELEELREAGDPQAVKRLEQEHLERKKRQAQITAEIQDLERSANRTRTELAQLRAQKEAAEGVAKNYGRSVDAVLDARDKGHLHGICGTIAELGNIDNRFATAIETAAGGRQQAIVVETAKDAQAAIEYLRRDKIGRATFLPLDKMARSMPRGKSLMAVKDPASHGFAIDLIDFEPRYENAFRYVFGDTVVVENLNDARRLMGGVRLVTVPGDLIEASGAMSGGATKGKRGVGFGGVDTSKIEKLSSELRAAETHIETLSEEIASVRGEILELEDKLRETRGSTESLQARRKALEKQREELAKKHGAAKETRHAKAKEVDKLDAEIETISDTVAKLRDTLADMDANRESLSRALMAGAKKELADRIRQLEKDLDDARVAANEAEKKRDVAIDKAKLIDERAQELRARVDKLVKEQEGHKLDMERLKGEMATLDTEIDKHESEVREASEALKGLHEQKDQIKDTLRELESQITRLADQAETNYMLIQKEKDGIPALEEQLGEVMVELKESGYEHPDEEALPPLDELRGEIRRLERAIEALGPINQRALEEYDEQAERKAELETEVAHLNDERKSLVQLVDEISKKKCDDFMVVFDEINRNFATVYAKLSIGGSAFLKLENEEDPFEGGMTLMVRPKGKKVLRIDAISGGEKSMTALAFIFAVQQYEPSPFYYLDEVDQNLDGVNSDTIGKMVKENCRKAQFIVVSLRKVTLRQADHIYGVTMQKVGLSEIIGDFNINRLRENGELAEPGVVHDDERDHPPGDGEKPIQEAAK